MIMFDFLMDYIMPIFMFILMGFVVILIIYTTDDIFEELAEKDCISEDVNCDSVVDIEDLLKVQKYILEKRYFHEATKIISLLAFNFFTYSIIFYQRC